MEVVMIMATVMLTVRVVGNVLWLWIPTESFQCRASRTAGVWRSACWRRRRRRQRQCRGQVFSHFFHTRKRFWIWIFDSDDPESRHSKKDKKNKKEKGSKTKSARTIVSASAAVTTMKTDRGKRVIVAAHLLLTRDLQELQQPPPLFLGQNPAARKRTEKLKLFLALKARWVGPVDDVIHVDIAWNAVAIVTLVCRHEW
jgi:hypothetical protein